MEDSQKRILIKRYFERPPKDIDWSWKWILFCVFVGPLLCCVRGAEAVGGCIIAAGILYVAYQLWSHAQAQAKYRNTPRATDEEFDEWLEEDLQRLSMEALDELGVDESELVGERVSILALPSYFDRSGAYTDYKIGADRILRFTPIDITLINLTEHQLISYQATFDFTTGNALNPSTDEYFYNDIVSVSTVKESSTVRYSDGSMEQRNDSETFRLVTAGGTTLSVKLYDRELIDKYGGERPRTRADEAVRVIRRTLRDKKSK